MSKQNEKNNDKKKEKSCLQIALTKLCHHSIENQCYFTFLSKYHLQACKMVSLNVILIVTLVPKLYQKVSLEIHSHTMRLIFPVEIMHNCVIYTRNTPPPDYLTQLSFHFIQMSLLLHQHNTLKFHIPVDR